MHKAFAAFTLGIVTTAAFGQTWQWKDAGGNTVISDTPPPGNARSSRSIGARTPSVVSEKPAAAPTTDNAPKSVAERDMEFRKRQQEARERTEKEAKEQQTVRDKQENCEQARRNLVALESDRAVMAIDEKGDRQAMDASQRAQEIERTRRIMAEACSK